MGYPTMMDKVQVTLGEALKSEEFVLAAMREVASNPPESLLKAFMTLDHYDTGIAFQEAVIQVLVRRVVELANDRDT